MAKTRRFNPDNEEFGFQDHRVSRRDIGAMHRQSAKAIRSALPKIRLVQANLPVEAAQPETAIHTLPEWFRREVHLDLIQSIGEQMLNGAQEA